MSKQNIRFEQDEPVMVVEGGWGLFSELEGSIIIVDACTVSSMRSTRYEMVVAADYEVYDKFGPKIRVIRSHHAVYVSLLPLSVETMTNTNKASCLLLRKRKLI